MIINELLAQVILRFNGLHICGLDQVQLFHSNCIQRFSGSILCPGRLHILFTVLKLRSTEAVPSGHTKIIFEIIERFRKVSAKS